MAGHTMKPYKRPQLLPESVVVSKKQRVVFNGSLMDDADAEFYLDPPPIVSPIEDTNMTTIHSSVALAVQDLPPDVSSYSSPKRRRLERFDSAEAVADCFK